MLDLSDLILATEIAALTIITTASPKFFSAMTRDSCKLYSSSGPLHKLLSDQHLESQVERITPLSHWTHLPHLVHGFEKEIHEMKPLKKQKNPFIAFVLAFLFGCFGIGFYLWSWRDFFYSFVVIVAFVLMFLPTGPFEFLALPLGHTVVATFAAYRVNTSNSNLELGH